MPSWNKDSFLDLLGDRAYTFANWCATSASKDAATVRFIIESMGGINFNSGLWKQDILPILLKNKVIDQACIDRIKESVGN